MSTTAFVHRGAENYAAGRRAAALASVGVVSVLLAGHLTGMILHVGPLSAHMAQHIVVMNIAAPIAALLLINAGPTSARHFFSDMAETALVWAMIAQIAALGIWHVPVVFEAARSSAVLLAAMHLSLLAVALFFWICVFSVRGNARWKPIVSLVVTGKLFCLLGALLILAPQPLYAFSGVTGADQELAGLLMIAACPLSYVVAAVGIGARFLSDLERETAVPRGVAGARI